MRLTERGRWVLVYLPTMMALVAVIIVGARLALGPAAFHP